MQQFPVKKNRNNMFIGPCPACGYDRYEHVQYLYRHGLNIAEISELIHLGYDRVKTYLAGIPSNGTTEIRKNAKKHPQAEEIQALFLAGFRKIEISEKLRLPYGVVSYNTAHLEPQFLKVRRMLEKTMPDEEYLIGKADPVPPKKTVQPMRNAFAAPRATSTPQLKVDRQPVLQPEYSEAEEDDVADEPQIEMLRVDKGIPMPETPPKGIGAALPLAEMAIGDSFLVPSGFMDAANDKSLKTRVHTALGNYRKKNGGRYIVRMTNKGVRVWRSE